MSRILRERLHGLLTCAATELEAEERTVPPGYISPGLDVAWDNCCEGQLWARVIQVFPTGTFPTKSTDLNPCASQLAARVGLGILRCQTGLQALDQGSAPSLADQESDAVGMLCDQAALHRAIACCGSHTVDGAVVLDQWNPLGPQGGCVGGEWTAWMEVTLDC